MAACLVSAAGGAHVWLCGQCGSEEPLETLLGDHPAGMKPLHTTLSKLKLVLVLIGRWNPRACGELSQKADAETADLIVNGPAVIAGVQSESELEQELHYVCRGRAVVESVTGVGSVAVGDVLERGFAFGTGFGPTMAGVSFGFVVGVGATRSAASSLVAALSE
eukprot:CAMPEP_0172620382 /NCGR_PEP_ID=MMETSP1068-20121228/103111_1 /TAXON_ID=35684 /ORGANISM="Pseudopedinella elastica, Strain CCMP716" /LENGTH=163 /DNA_ID=CAMNT_0013427619 /DNA_START=207 /DNA_END=699 /DNA_ORIENTATION=-